MSSTQPASTTELKEYALRKLGKPVIDINLADEQMNDMNQSKCFKNIILMELKYIICQNK